MDELGREITERQENYLFFNNEKNKYERRLLTKVNKMFNAILFSLMSSLCLILYVFDFYLLSFFLLGIIFIKSFLLMFVGYRLISSAEDSLLFSKLAFLFEEYEDYKDNCTLRTEALERLHEKFRSILKDSGFNDETI